MIHWICDRCGLRVYTEDDSKPRCPTCNAQCIRCTGEGEQLPAGFRNCDVNQNPFYKGLRTYE